MPLENIFLKLQAEIRSNYEGTVDETTARHPGRPARDIPAL